MPRSDIGGSPSKSELAPILEMEENDADDEMGEGFSLDSDSDDAELKRILNQRSQLHSNGHVKHQTTDSEGHLT